MSFDKHRAPTLPAPPNSYVAPYFNQLIRTIGNYFKLIDSRAGITLESITANFVRIPSGEYTIGSVATHNNVALPKTSFVRFVGATGYSDITGFDAETATDGQMLIVYNASGHNARLMHNDAGSLAGNKILTGGSNVTLSNQHGAILIYSVNDIPPTPTGYWILLAHK